MGSGQLSGEKKAISDKIDSMREGLVSLSHDIHGHPETGFQEYHAVEAIEAFLKGQGMVMERDYCQIPTAFRAVKKGRGKGPVVAFLAEYDALRGIGHGCGHNVIAACAVGAFLGLASRREAHDGEIWLIGTPAEEGGAGKVLMLERGGFDGVDFALMMHPTGGGEAYNYMNRGGRASGSVTVSFHGKAAHSSTPASGINALNAAISVFNQIDMLRPAFQIQDNINGVILDGGTAEMCIRDRIKVNLNLMPKSNFFTYIKPAENKSMLLQTGWSDASGDGLSLLHDMLRTYNREAGQGTVNRGHYSNPEVDALISQAFTEFDDAKRGELVAEADKIARDDYAYIPLHFEQDTYAIKDTLNYTPRMNKYVLAWEFSYK